MKPGDKAMLVGTQGWSSRLWIKECRVRAVHKTGHILIEGSDQKYRADGWPTWKSSYSRSEQLRPWDDALWQQFQMEQQNADEATRLWALGELMVKIARSDEARAAAIWKSLPSEVRALIEKDAQGGEV